MTRRRIRAHYEQLSKFERVVSSDCKRKVRQIGESLVKWVEAMRPLEDAGKNGWTMADFSVMRVAVDLGPSRSGGQIDCQISCHSACFIVINNRVRHGCPP
ncbi:hypothetical protein TNCV_4370671 [Trichonephila clavipes]|uniref:Uncharacterized protein n=1 Tax=Trichonephila clavipes TaxID=2585209 RepID=A0A8X6VF32_TRICX|nr:hypothetical protein TNCV_4370671 [Trichonephila clavipes]